MTKRRRWYWPWPALLASAGSVSAPTPSRRCPTTTTSTRTIPLPVLHLWYWLIDCTIFHQFWFSLSEDVTPNGSLRRRRSRVPSEEDDTLMDYLRTSGHADGSRERKSTGNIRNPSLLVSNWICHLRVARGDRSWTGTNRFSVGGFYGTSRWQSDHFLYNYCKLFFVIFTGVLLD